MTIKLLKWEWDRQWIEILMSNENDLNYEYIVNKWLIDSMVVWIKRMNEICYW